MLLDFIISYIVVGLYMAFCVWRSQRNSVFPVSGRYEWAALAAACLIWPKIWWDDGVDI